MLGLASAPTSRCSRRRPAITTRLPSRWNDSAKPRPIPVPPPVTSTVLPVICIAFSFFGFQATSQSPHVSASEIDAGPRPALDVATSAELVLTTWRSQLWDGSSSRRGCHTAWNCTSPSSPARPYVRHGAPPAVPPTVAAGSNRPGRYMLNAYCSCEIFISQIGVHHAESEVRQAHS